MTQTQINKIALAAVALSLALFVASAPAHSESAPAHAVGVSVPTEASTLSQVLLDADFEDGEEFDG